MPTMEVTGNAFVAENGSALKCKAALFEPLDCDILTPTRLNCPYYYQPDDFMRDIAERVRQSVMCEPWQPEAAQGKMLGLLIVTDKEGRAGFLKAYSGQVCGRADWPGWVPAVFDYLYAGSPLLAGEARVKAIGMEISETLSSPRYRLACSRLANAEADGEREVAAWRAAMSASKSRRDEERSQGVGSEAERIKASQFEKAELRRLRQRVAERVTPLRDAVAACERRIAEMRCERKTLSDTLQRWLFDSTRVTNALGEWATLTDIFRPTASHVPPSGAGECCAPKLLQYAFTHGLRPVAVAEFWYGRSPVGEVRREGEFYPACQGKCRPILDFMLRGTAVEPNPLEAEEETVEVRVLYEDDVLVAVEKPAGMLATPGRSARRSTQEIVQAMRPGMPILAVHRLDMQTSGILLFAKSETVQRLMQRQFAERQVSKRYTAVLDGVPERPREGDITLPLAPDYVNRPCQRVDPEHGREALTHYIIESTAEGRARLALFPHTGRTHQLRLHCAHPGGLGVPIVGDDLYGRHARRLLLHAGTLTFRHPVSGETVSLESPCPF